VSESRLTLVLACGERGVCHLIEAGALAGELYFAPATVAPGPLRARVAGVEIELDPRVPIGDQVATDAEIHFPAG
jgi:hypothetical protein